MLSTMNPIDWLCKNAHGFSNLSEEERAAIMHFALLWSLFEAEALDTNASASNILALVNKWADQDLLNIAAFTQSLAYFKDRYFKNGLLTDDFSGLDLRKNDKPTLVSAVLKGENTNPTDCVAVLFIIVFRLRNNLFHGKKWAYEIRGQLDNFAHANDALMAALELNRKYTGF